MKQDSEGERVDGRCGPRKSICGLIHGRSGGLEPKLQHRMVHRSWVPAAPISTNHCLPKEGISYYKLHAPAGGWVGGPSGALIASITSFLRRRRQQIFNCWFREKRRCVAFANFPDVNTPTKADFKLPTWPVNVEWARFAHSSSTSLQGAPATWPVRGKPELDLRPSDSTHHFTPSAVKCKAATFPVKGQIEICSASWSPMQ